ncbi:hypothetical protein BKA66DRAFT_438274 [Pyrenochaeta sp. MPI-SDFR-AT-0127]|nr:hypothetical protein BKA66DRAFT_438274 [Pyrenochaeta sp. MPI-SDFR-AT-0127]
MLGADVTQQPGSNLDYSLEHSLQKHPSNHLSRSASIRSFQYQYQEAYKILTMTILQPREFLALPTEIRLEVYRYLAISALATGSASCMYGLYLTSRLIRDEMERETVSKMRKLLETQHSWNSAIQTDAPLRIHLPESGSSNFSIDEISLFVPICEASDPRDEIHPDPATFGRICILLCNLFKLPCSTMTINFYYPPLGGDYEFNLNIEVMETLLNRIKSHDKEGSAFRQIDRLAIQLGPYGGPANIEGTYYCIVCAAIVTGSVFIPEVKRAWLAVDGPGQFPVWTVGFDFTDGLSMVSGKVDEIDLHRTGG